LALVQRQKIGEQLERRLIDAPEARFHRIAETPFAVHRGPPSTRVRTATVTTQSNRNRQPVFIRLAPRIT
jgi:hypothetical protein